MLKINYIPHMKLESSSAKDRVDMILSIVKNHSIVITDCRLNVRDEAALIRETMGSVDEGFNGIEIGFLNDNHEQDIFTRIRHNLARMLTGSSRGLTIIGPANIIRELKSNPESVELYFQKQYIKSLKR